ncbi:phosphotransferase [Salininema proteolyticum]|uniref:Phosphotransferase n=1 Tax=Salininema proteolyticum TaxID=1607685 RepID=A0ABV8TU88_9ACTN
MPFDEKSLSEAYGIGGVLGRDELFDGHYHRSWKVTTETGAYALKQMRPPVARVETKLAMAWAMADRGLPVPRPRRAAHGRYVWIDGDSEHYLVEWAEGEHRRAGTLTLSQAESYGAAMAGLHREMDAGFLDAGSLGRYRRSPIAVEDALAQLDRFAGVIDAKDVADDFDALAREVIGRKRELLHRFASHRPVAPARREEGLLHGDFLSQNLLWQGDRVAAVIDWDRLQYGPVSHEVARTCTVDFGMNSPGDRLDLDSVTAFVRGYHSVRPLDPEDLAFAVAHEWWEGLTHFWMLVFHFDRAKYDCDLFFAPEARFCDWWCENLEAVQEAFADGIA